MKKCNRMSIWTAFMTTITMMTSVAIMIALFSPRPTYGNVNDQPACTDTAKHYVGWQCNVGSVKTPGSLNKTTDIICVGGSSSASVSGTTFNDGSKAHSWYVNCPQYKTGTDSPVAIKYAAQVVYEPPIPTTFPTAGTFPYTVKVKGVTTDTDCPADTDLVPVDTYTVTVISAEVKSVIFTSDHGVLTDYNSDYAGNGGSVYSPRGWQKSPLKNNPVTHSQGVPIGVTVVISVCPSGLTYDITGTCGNGALSFHKTGITSTGSDQSIALTSDAALPAKVDVINETISWNVTVSSKQCSAGTSAHTVYVLWSSPFGTWTPTVKRVNWICSTAQGATSIDEAEAMLHEDLVSYFYLYNNCLENPWLVLDGDGPGYDCESLSACQGIASQILGVPALLRYAYPSTDLDCSSAETRICPGGVHGSEQLCIHIGNDPDMQKGWNVYDACAVVNGKWYPGGLSGGPFNSALDVIRDWLSSGTPYQAWLYPKNTACSDPGPNPVPGP